MNLPAIAVYPDVEAAAIKWPQPEVDQPIVDYVISLTDNAEAVFKRQDHSHAFKAGYLFGTIKIIKAIILQQQQKNKR